MAIWTRSALAAGAALLAVACGSVTSNTGTLNTGTSGTPAAVAGPAVTVTPDTALTGGQRLRVTVTGFPPDVGLELYECAAPATSCQDGATTYVGTGPSGSASTTFIAQPSVLVGTAATPTECDRQCDLVAVAVKDAQGIVPQPAPAATAPLAFASSAAAVPNLADSALLSISWVSAADGWALAVQPCAEGTCARVARTTDGGQHWQVLPDPPAVHENDYGCADLSCAGQVSFASRQVGYLYGPALLMTTDGGLTWHAQPAPLTEALTVAGGEVYRVAFNYSGCPGPCQPVLQEAPAGSADWRTLLGDITPPDRSDSAQIAVSGPDILLALYGGIAGPLAANAVVYRSADGGGTWRQQADPCGGPGPQGQGQGTGQEKDLTALAAAPGGFFAGVCTVRASLSAFVITSADGGVTWQATAATPPHPQWGDVIAAASPTTIALASGPVGGNGSVTAVLLVTADGGRHWTTAATDPQDLGGEGTTPASVSFETSLAGQWLGDPHGIWTTTDGGLHWTRTAFR